MWGRRVLRRAFERLEPHEGKLCAADRSVESLTQSGGARRNAPGSSDLPEGEKPEGKRACRKSGGHWKTLKVPSRKTRVIRRKLHCLNPNPQRWNLTLAATASTTQRHQGRIVKFSRSATSDWRGDEERLH